VRPHLTKFLLMEAIAMIIAKSAYSWVFLEK
jgi:hypothetical protein